MEQINNVPFKNIALQLDLIETVRQNSGYMARLEIEFLKEKCRRDPKRLEQFGFKVYSQNDEDGILHEIFKRLNIKMGSFCEIGVQNGLECNTLFLIHKGWRGVWLDGDKQQEQAIIVKFATILDNKRLGLSIKYITPLNVNQQLLESCQQINIEPNGLDFLSIDIDGMDIYLLEALIYKPKLICIEYNAKFPPPLLKKPVYKENYAWGGTDYMGSSLSAISEVANLKGYRLIATNLTGANAFFIRNDLLDEHFSEDLSLDFLYNPPRYYLSDHYSRDVGHKADFGAYQDLV